MYYFHHLIISCVLTLLNHFQFNLEYPPAYLDNALSKIELPNSIKVNKINHLDSNYNLTSHGKMFHNEYSVSRQLGQLFSKKELQINMESIKKTNFNIENMKFEFILEESDGITNIKILCDSHNTVLKYIKLSSDQFFEQSIEKSIDFESTGYVYSIYKFDDLRHLINIGKEITIHLYFELLNNNKSLSITYDRVSYDEPLR